MTREKVFFKQLFLLLVCVCSLIAAGAENPAVLQLEKLDLTASKSAVYPAQPIKLNPGSGYIISGRISGSGGNLKAGMLLFNDKKSQIYPHMVNPAAGTETVLLNDAVKGSQTFIVRDAAKLLPAKRASILCFHAREDLADLPNIYCEYYVEKITPRADGSAEITMSKGLTRSYPAGTMLRQHFGGSMMTFNLDQSNITPEGVDFTATALPAQNKKYAPDVIWHGTTAAQITLQSSQDACISNLTLREIPPADARKMASSRIVSGGVLKGNVKTFNAQKNLPASDAVEMLSASRGKSGFYQMNLDWQAAEIKQLEFTVKTDRPGYFKLDYTAKLDGKRYPVASTLAPIAATADGNYHTIVFDMQNDLGWRGTVSNWELSWNGPETVVGLKKIYASDINNIVSNADTFQSGEIRLLKNFKPRTECRMFWRDGKSTALTLRGLDYNMQYISDWRVELPADGSGVEFTVPEDLVWGELTAGEISGGYPVIEQLDKYIPPFKSPHQWRGQWIWSQKEWGPFNSYVWFEKEFTLEEKPVFAVLSYLADDSAVVYVNGNKAGAVHHFQNPGRAEITKWLKKGKNRITVRVFNGEQNSGLVVNGFIKLSRREFFLDSDQSWKCDPVSNSDAIPQNISRPTVELGDPNTTRPWANLIGFLYAGKCGQIQVQNLTADSVTFKILELPPVKVDRFNFKVTDLQGKSTSLEIPIKIADDQWQVNATVKANYSPVSWGNESFTLQLQSSEYLIVRGAAKADIKVAQQPVPPIRQAQFINVGTRPMIKLGEEVISPVFFLAGHTVDARRWYELDNAREMGFENFRMEADFLNFWRAPGKYDFSWFDETMRRLFCSVPKAFVTVQVYVHMPDWWLEANADDTSKLYGNAERYRHRDKQALGSKKWLNDAGETLKVLIEHLKKSPWADRIWGINVCENGNGEWFWWRMDAQENPAINGYSAADYATFRAYLREKYITDEALAKAWNQPQTTLDNAMMPKPDRVNHGSVGTMLNPARDMQLIDWYIFRNRALADAIIHFSKVIKEATDGKWLAGAYYGYFTELAENTVWRLQQVGHNGFLEVAQSPYVDYVQAPSRYTYRKLGMSDQLMHVWDTFLLNGKTVYCEQDVRTALGPGSDTGNYTIYLGIAPTRADSIGQLNRGLGMALATGTNYYNFDIAMGALYEKAYRSTIHEQLDLIKKIPLPQGLIPVETAIVSDRDSTYMIKAADSDGIFTGAISGLYPRFNELAAPYHSLNLTDLLAGKAARHKLYIMLPTLVLSKEQRKMLLKRFQQEGASVVWLHSAGPDYPDHGPAAENNGDFLNIRTSMQMAMQQPIIKTTPEWGALTGKNYNTTSPWFYPSEDSCDEVIGRDDQERAVLVRKKLGNSEHYFSTLTNLPVEFYAMLMDKINIRRYLSDMTDPVWAGNDTVTIFAKSDGMRSLNLPEGITARGIIGPFRGTVSNGEEFQVHANQSYIFLLEKK